MIYWWDHRGHR